MPIAGNPILTHTFRTLNARLHALRFRSNLVQAKWDQAVKSTARWSRLWRRATGRVCATCW